MLGPPSAASSRTQGGIWGAGDVPIPPCAARDQAGLGTWIDYWPGVRHLQAGEAIARRAIYALNEGCDAGPGAVQKKVAARAATRWGSRFFPKEEGCSRERFG